MSRLIHAHPVERLVRAYLERLRKTNKTRTDRQILIKASFLISAVLLDPCCPGGDSVAPGNVENYFIVQLRSLLNGINVRVHRESLERAVDLLKFRLEGCCINLDFTGEWNSLNTIDFFSIRTLTENDVQQGIFSESWGNFQAPSTISGSLLHNSDTDKIEFSYTAAIPSGVSICVHLQQNGNEIEGSPFDINIPGSGDSNFTIFDLKGKIDGSLPLFILVDNNCF